MLLKHLYKNETKFIIIILESGISLDHKINKLWSLFSIHILFCIQVFYIYNIFRKFHTRARVEKGRACDRLIGFSINWLVDKFTSLVGTSTVWLVWSDIYTCTSRYIRSTYTGSAGMVTLISVSHCMYDFSTSDIHYRYWLYILLLTDRQQRCRYRCKWP